MITKFIPNYRFSFRFKSRRSPNFQQKPDFRDIFADEYHQRAPRYKEDDTTKIQTKTKIFLFLENF